MAADRPPPPADTAPAVVVDRLRVVRSGRLVIDDLSCSVAPGSVTGLLGPSGSGKTTLMRAIVGVQVVASGRVDVLGRPGQRHCGPGSPT